MIKIGEKAPEFSHITAYRKGEFTTVSLSDYRGKWVVLFFYPRDFTFICPTEIREFARLQTEFSKCGCSILGASTDSEHSHKAWFERDLPEVTYPILADTTQQVSRDYNVLGADGAYAGMSPGAAKSGASTSTRERKAGAAAAIWFRSSSDARSSWRRRWLWPLSSWIWRIWRPIS